MTECSTFVMIQIETGFLRGKNLNWRKTKLGKKKTLLRHNECFAFYFYKYIHFGRFLAATAAHVIIAKSLLSMHIDMKTEEVEKKHLLICGNFKHINHMTGRCKQNIMNTKWIIIKT